MVSEEMYVNVNFRENEITLSTIKNDGKLSNLEELSDFRDLEKLIIKIDLF